MQTLTERSAEAQTMRSFAARHVDRIAVVAFAVAMAASLLVFFATLSQPILEWFGFRQAQTALTAYWFLREGFALAYQTPVVGYPWQIPLELPLFQALVALIASIADYPLERIGRAVSFAFFVATLFPVAVICRELQFGHRVFFVFGALYLVSPQYLFWGRTFMIESAATFFSVATLAAAIPLFTRPSITIGRGIGIVVLGSVALTLKVTTGLPVLAVLLACLGLVALGKWRTGDAPHAGRLLLSAVLLILPVVIAFMWTQYTDAIKAQNEIGKLLTSKALTSWNFGTVRQRISAPLFTEVIWRRSLAANAAGLLGVAVLIYFFIEEKRRARLVIGACLTALFLLPLFTFTNLHLIHNYYQTANVIFLLLLVALALDFLAERISPRVFLLVFALALVSNVVHFRNEGWRFARMRITPENNAVLAAARIIREQSAPEKPILVYGLEWSSELAYYAERKAMSVPNFYPKFDEPLLAPERYFESADVGALVICPASKMPSEEALERFLKTHGPFRETVVHQCRVFVDQRFSTKSASG